jgi:hypothetical protein
MGVMIYGVGRIIMAWIMGVMMVLAALIAAMLGGIVILGSAGIMSVIVGAVSIMILPG